MGYFSSLLCCYFILLSFKQHHSLIFSQWGGIWWKREPGAYEMLSDGGEFVGSTGERVNCRLDAFILARCWYWQFSGRLAALVINQVIWCLGETAESRGCLSIRNKAAIPIHGAAITILYVPHACALSEKVVFIIWGFLEVYSILRLLSIIRRCLNNASGVPRREGVSAPTQRICM